MNTTNEADMQVDIAVEMAFAMICKWEGFREEAYRCPAGVLTIGWGRTGGVLETDRTTKDAEESWLKKRVKDELLFVSRALPGVALNPRQQAALVSLVYNIGRQAFMASGVRAGLLAGDNQLALGRWAQWNKVAGKVVKGLTRRREDELSLFLS